MYKHSVNSIRNKKTMRISLLVRIFVQEDQRFPFHLANAVKYICRAGKKDPAKTTEDLSKAVWYINRYIGMLKKEGGAV